MFLSASSTALYSSKCTRCHPL